MPSDCSPSPASPPWPYAIVSVIQRLLIKIHLTFLKYFTAERASESDSITNEDSSDNQISMNQNTTTAHDGATTIKTQDEKGKEWEEEEDEWLP